MSDDSNQYADPTQPGSPQHKSFMPGEHLFTTDLDLDLLLHRMREFAAHDSTCDYEPIYPETADTTCTCGFDKVLDDYDRWAAL